MTSDAFDPVLPEWLEVDRQYRIPGLPGKFDDVSVPRIANEVVRTARAMSTLATKIRTVKVPKVADPDGERRNRALRHTAVGLGGVGTVLGFESLGIWTHTNLSAGSWGGVCQHGCCCVDDGRGQISC